MYQELPSLANTFLRQENIRAIDRVVNFDFALQIREQLADSHYVSLTMAKFDPLNFSHVQYLEDLASKTQDLARNRQAEPLVAVGVWSDEFLFRRQSSELNRARIVAGQKGVDLVFILTDETQADQFKPDFGYYMPESVDNGLITIGRITQPRPIKPNLRLIKG